MMTLELPFIGKPSWESSSYLCCWRCSWNLQVCSFNPNSTFHPLIFIYRIIFFIQCEHKQKLPSHSWLHEYHLFSPSNIIIKQTKKLKLTIQGLHVFINLQFYNNKLNLNQNTIINIKGFYSQNIIHIFQKKLEYIQLVF
jgi:hypothetical protein